MRLAPPLIGEPDTDARATGHVGVRHDEVGCPQDACADPAPAGAADLDRHLPELIGDPGEVRNRLLNREKGAHRRSPEGLAARSSEEWSSSPLRLPDLSDAPPRD